MLRRAAVPTEHEQSHRFADRWNEENCILSWCVSIFVLNYGLIYIYIKVGAVRATAPDTLTPLISLFPYTFATASSEHLLAFSFFVMVSDLSWFPFRSIAFGFGTGFKIISWTIPSVWNLYSPIYPS